MAIEIEIYGIKIYMIDKFFVDFGYFLVDSDSEGFGTSIGKEFFNF